MSGSVKLTSNVEKRDLSVLGSTTDQVDRNAAGLILGGSIPDDIEGRASGDDLVGIGLVNGVEVGSLGESSGSQGHDGRNREVEVHLEGGDLTKSSSWLLKGSRNWRSRGI